MKNEDEDRFRSMYERYYRRVVRYYVLTFRLEQEDAEELAQDAFLKFFKSMKEYRGEAEWAYLEAIARNLAFNRVRSLKTAKRGLKPLPLDDPEVFRNEPAAPAQPDYEALEERAAQSKRLHAAIAQLPDRQRQCVQLYLSDLKYAGIANALHVSIDAVRTALRDAKRSLRERLGDEGMLPEEES